MLFRKSVTNQSAFDSCNAQKMIDLAHAESVKSLGFSGSDMTRSPKLLWSYCGSFRCLNRGGYTNCLGSMIFWLPLANAHPKPVLSPQGLAVIGQIPLMPIRRFSERFQTWIKNDQQPSVTFNDHNKNRKRTEWEETIEYHWIQLNTIAPPKKYWFGFYHKGAKANSRRGWLEGQGFPGLS